MPVPTFANELYKRSVQEKQTIPATNSEIEDIETMTISSDSEYE